MLLGRQSEPLRENHAASAKFRINEIERDTKNKSECGGVSEVNAEW